MFRSMRSTRLTLGACCIAFILQITTGGAFSATDADRIIAQRQHAMAQLKDDAEALRQVVAGDIQADRLAPIAAAVAEDAKAAAAAFQANVPGGRTKAEVWSNNADFAKRMQEMVRKATAMASVGESGDLSAVSTMMGEALPCKSCHDLYREQPS